MRFPTKKQLAIFSVVIVVFLTSGLGAFLGWKYGVSSCKICPPENLDFSLFWESWKNLKDHFYDPTKFDIEKMIYGAISGMVNSLGDPYTVFFNPQETEDFFKSAEGVFEGIGAEIDKKKDQIIIVAPLEGTPAQRAGLRAGDKILKINDKETTDMSVEEVVSLIRGAKGTEVTLTIFREGWKKSQEFKITRDVIKVPPIKWELKKATNGDNVVYIRIYQFTANAGTDFREKIFEVLSSPAQKIILDLRDNPGGYLDSVKDISDWFLKRGDVIAIEDFGEGKEKKESIANGNEMLYDFPVVILINHGSASGSEILAGALRENRKNVLLLGETSFGKGLVQEVYNLKEGSSIKITIAKWLTPRGVSITDKGLEPDIKVEMTEEDYENDRDPQLDKALEVIQGLK